LLHKKRVVVVVTGTPGTGKTTLARKLTDRLGGTLLNVNELILSNKLYTGTDDIGTRIVDLKKLRKKLLEAVNATSGTVVLDSHLLSDIRIEGSCDAEVYVVVLRLHLKPLLKRLIARNYPKAKIRDNIVSEALGYCSSMARERYSNVIEVESGKGALKIIIDGLAKAHVKTKELDYSGELLWIISKHPEYAI
jgi:adenylate kinase